MQEDTEEIARASVRSAALKRELLERAPQLAALEGLLAAVAESREGRLLFVGGEAGVGKTSLLRHFCAEHNKSARILWGSCDSLITPRPLGPLIDVAQATGGELEDLTNGEAKPHEVATALTKELRSQAPTILVLDDVHWADDATLDLLRLLGRRIESVPALVIAGYRDDEVDRAHPLRVVLGELATQPAVDRLELASLSREAVTKLAGSSGIDAQELYEKTGGNPFFVTEILASGGRKIPNTVRDAVLGRAARLSTEARTLLEAVAVAPLNAEVWLLERVAGEELRNLEECLSTGMLRTESGGVAFRHELGRLAIEESLPPDRRLDLHRKVLVALAAPPTGEADVARLAHHAEAAGDSEAVLRHAPAAAERAVALGAHREAAAQYARALRFADEMPEQTRGGLLERRAYELYLTGRFEDAIEVQEQALECHRRLGDRRREGESLWSLSRLMRYVGRTQEASATGRRAVEVLEQFPAGRELAMAYSNVSYLCMSVEDAAGTIEWGTRGIELAERLGDVEPLVYALTNIGTVELLAGMPDARDKLERSLNLAKDAGLGEHAGRVFTALTWWSPRGRAYPLTAGYLEAGLEYCAERGLDIWRHYLVAGRGRGELDGGDWDRAAESAMLVVRDPRGWPVPRILALSVQGLVRARRGDADPWPLLEEAWELAKPTAELQRIAPAAAARAETAWLEGRRDAVEEATEAALELALLRRASWVIGELAYWRWRAGIKEEIPSGASGPYVAHMSGDPAEAVLGWEQLDSPYEAALARAESGEEDQIRAAFATLQGLGASATITALTRDLRARGVDRIPRGPRVTTRSDPAGLTVREGEVLELIEEGLRNAEIAERFSLSERTVAHHVSSILTKLGVSSRGAAPGKARELRQR